jgi:uncharacterized membrane protein YdjX (TVP38/TMEM64 family)
MTLHVDLFNRSHGDHVMTTSPATKSAERDSSGSFRRYLPLAVLAALMALGFAMGWHKYLSFKTIGTNYEYLKTLIADHFVVALAAYMAIYIAVVALSAPGGLIMTLAGGLLFGWKVGIPATVISATVGASILFLIAKSSFGETLAAKAGPVLGKFRDGFKENALSYLLFLRLVPIFPFVLVNIAPALLGVPFRTYVIGTLLGIIPGTSAFSVVGAGLGSVVEAQNKVYQSCLAAKPANPDAACPYTIDTSALLTKELLAAFVLLGIVALIPVAMKYLRGRNAQG